MPYSALQHRELETACAYLAAIVRSSDDALISTDLEGLITSWNPAAQQLYGYSEAEVLARHVSLIAAPEHRAEMEEILNRVRHGETVARYQVIRKHKNGRGIFISLTVSPIVDSEGRIVGASKISRNVGEQKPLELALYLAQAMIRDVDGTILLATKGLCVLYGRGREELVGKRSHEILQTEFPAPLEEINATLLRTGEWKGELQQRRADGTTIWVASHWALQRDAAGNPTFVVEVNNDITEQKAVEEQLRHSQRMDSIGRLAGGIAHDFNNLLTVILGYSILVYEQLEDSSPLRPALQEVRRAGELASMLTGQLLAFSRKRPMERRLLDVNELLAENVSMLQRLVGEDVEFLFVPLKVGTVDADPGQLVQVLMNLAANARDAMPKGGKVTIETRSVTRDREDAGKFGIRPPGSYVVIEVTDTGAGMDAPTAERIFEPFFTTKAINKGTGLGLATSWGIVRQHSGWIDVYSELGLGTTFRIYLPEKCGVTPEAAALVAKPKRQPRTATILLIEDQAPLRMLAEDVLTAEGHRVLSAPDGARALRAIDDFAAPIDMLISDVVMPGMSGPDLGARLSARFPDLLILFMSGYGEHALLRDGAMETGTAFLHKPFLPESLTAKVQELLADRP